MLKHIGKSEFQNRETLGQFAEILFDTYVEMAGGKESVEKVSGRVHYFEKGQGQPVLMLHGLCQSLYTFRNNIGDLAESRRVIAVDLPGQGYSECPAMTYTIEEYAMAIKAFADALGIEEFSMVCFGQACAYGLEFSAYNKGCVDKLVLINPGPFMATDYPGAKGIASGLGGTANKLAKEAFVRKCLEKAYFDKTLITDAMIDEYARPFANPEVRLATKQAAAAFDDGETLERMVNIDAKILLITSQDDMVSRKPDIKLYQDNIRNGYVYEMRNCGYLPHEEKPAGVNSAILEFLEK